MLLLLGPRMPIGPHRDGHMLARPHGVETKGLGRLAGLDQIGRTHRHYVQPDFHIHACALTFDAKLAPHPTMGSSDPRISIRPPIVSRCTDWRVPESWGCALHRC